MFRSCVLYDTWNRDIGVARTNVDNDASTQISNDCTPLHSPWRLSLHYTSDELREEQGPFYVDVEESLKFRHTRPCNLIGGFYPDLDLVSKRLIRSQTSL